MFQPLTSHWKFLICFVCFALSLSLSIPKQTLLGVLRPDTHLGYLVTQCPILKHFSRKPEEEMEKVEWS